MSRDLATKRKFAGDAGATAAIDGIAAVAREFSLEATFPSRSEIDALRSAVPAGTHVYLSCPPNHDPESLVPVVAAVRAAGLEPVPHLTARSYKDAAELENVLSRLQREAAVTTALVIAGDRDVPAGNFDSALSLIESDLLQQYGIREVGISGYPDGHPKIDDSLLRRSLMQKLEAAAARNLSVHVTTQFCFDAQPVLAWLRWLRGEDVRVPVRVGVAGPTSMRALMKFALRCGVRASLKGMLNPKAIQLLGEAAPDNIVRGLAEAEDRANLDPVSIHYFSFGGILRTAEWACAAAAGRVEPTAEGFRVIK